MKTRLTAFLLIASFASGCAQTQRTESRDEKRYAQTHTQTQTQTAERAPESAHRQTAKSEDPHGHSHGEPGRVPAYESDPKNLPPTLDPARFTGKTRLAYQYVREIPDTIAQLPCYCHCDEGFGHKSLHSCYVDDHASMCAVCVNEVLQAYRMEKEEGLAPEEIRERIVSEYSKMH